MEGLVLFLFLVIVSLIILTVFLCIKSGETLEADYKRDYEKEYHDLRDDYDTLRHSSSNLLKTLLANTAFELKGDRQITLPSEIIDQIKREMYIDLPAFTDREPTDNITYIGLEGEGKITIKGDK